MTLEPIRQGFEGDSCIGTKAKWTLIEGLLPEESKIYSWLPCLPYNKNAQKPLKFKRPIVELKGLNPELRQGFKVLDKLNPEEAWNSVVRQVQKQGLKICAGLDVPGEKPEASFSQLAESRGLIPRTSCYPR